MEFRSSYRCLEYGAPRRLQPLAEQRRVNKILPSITENLTPDDARAYASQRFQEMYNGFPAGCACYDQQGRIFAWNSSFDSIYGLERGDNDRARQRVLSSIEASRLNFEQVRRIFSGDAATWKEWEDRRADETPCVLLVTDCSLKHPNGRIIAGVHIQVDITGNKSQQDAIIAYSGGLTAAVVSDTDVNIRVDDTDCIATWNHGAQVTFGYRAEEVIGKPLTLLLPDLYDHSPTLPAEKHAPCVKSHFAGKTMEIHGNRKGGSIFPAALSVGTYDVRGDLVTTAVIRDITRQKHSEWRLRKEVEEIKSHNVDLYLQKGELEADNHKLEILARMDVLTGLKNRRAFQERLALEFHRAGRYLVPLSLLLLDIDHFKPYNDLHGHSAGDAVIIQIAQILVQNARGVDFVARYGGEEFAVILPHTAEMGAATIAERFRVAIESVEWPNTPVTVSFGAATLSPGSGDTETLISEADKALYLSKSRGRNCVTHFGDALKQG